MSDQPTIPTVTVPVLMTPKDFAKLTKVGMTKARAIFRTAPTVRVGKSRRMSYATFQRLFLDKEA